MPLHFPSHRSRTQLALSPNSGSTSAVNKTSTFGLGPAQWKIKDEQHSAALSQSLRSMRNLGFLSDITFTYDDESIKANRVVLAAVSPVMRNVFMKRESLLNADAIPPEALHQLVQFVYNVNTEIQVEAIKKIYHASHILQVTSVKRMCENLLRMLPDDHKEPAPRRPKLQRMIGFDEASVGSDDVTDGQASSSSDKENLSQVSGSESTDSNPDINLSMSAFKRDVRPSIKVTFHSRCPTPLNRSTEDLNSNSVESLETGCNDSTSLRQTPEGLHNTSTSAGRRIPTPKSEPQLKRLGKSLDERITQKPRSGSYNVPSPTPILLSSVMNGGLNGDGVTQGQKKTSPKVRGSILKETGNGTWPTRMRATGRSEIPDEWKKKSYDILDSPGSKEKSDESKPVQEKKKRHKSRDVYTVGFRSKSIPGLLKGLNYLRDQTLFCDLTLIVGNARINCHKVVLAASSPVFSAIVQKINTTEIVLTKVEENAVQEIVRYIYTGQCTIDKENAMGLLRAAYRFQFQFLVRQCTSYLERNCSSYNGFFTAENVLLAYRLSGMFGFPRLREESRKFATSRFWELTETQAFKELSSLDLNKLISCETLRTARIRDNDLELQFFIALIRWLTYKSSTRIPAMTSRVMKFVQFDNMKASVINRVVTKESIVMADPDTRQRILMALHNQTAPQYLSHAIGGGSPRKQARKGNVVAFISHNETYDSKKTMNKLYSVNSTDNIWEDLGQSPVTWGGFAVTSQGAALYVAGGRDVRKNRHTSNEVYKYENQQWTQMSNMKIERSHFALVSCEGTLYALGGMTESVEKGVSGYQITGCIERLVADSRRGHLKWKMSSASISTPSYFHSAVFCEATMRYSALDAAFMSVKREKADLKKPSSPSKTRMGQRLRSSTGSESGPAFSRVSPKQNALKYKKPSFDNANEDPHSHTITRPVILICGGKSKPMQNVMFDPQDERMIEKRPLPCPCTSPIMSSTTSRAYLISTGNVDSAQVNALLYEYSFNSDQWTEIKLPFSVGIQSPPTNKLTRLRASFRREDKSAPVKPLVSCVANGKQLVYVITQTHDVIIHTYDVTSTNWTSTKHKKSFDVAARAMQLSVLYEKSFE